MAGTDSPSAPGALTAARRWTAWLQEWGIPRAILDAAPESPWGFDTELFARRAQAAQTSLTVSNRRALEALPPAGQVLDVGCGGGAASAPLAPGAALIAGVDSSPGMLQAFRRQMEELGVRTITVEGRWPDVAADAPAADVVVCHHVAYNAPDLATFAAALTSHARRRVVLELTAEHPLSRLNPLWQRFHNLRRPRRPTADDAVAVLRELGLDVHRDNWEQAPDSGMIVFSDARDLTRWTRRRLCLPAERDGEVWAALQAVAVSQEGLWGLPPLPLVTLWWQGTASPS